MQYLVDHASPIDLVTVSERLEQEQQLDDAGGFAYSWDCKNTPSATNISSYAKIIRERYYPWSHSAGRNRWRGFCSEGRDAAELLDFAEVKSLKFQNHASMNKKALNRYVRSWKRRSIVLSSCIKIRITVSQVYLAIYQDLDKMTAGFQPADLVIVR